MAMHGAQLSSAIRSTGPATAATDTAAATNTADARAGSWWQLH